MCRQERDPNRRGAQTSFAERKILLRSDRFVSRASQLPVTMT